MSAICVIGTALPVRDGSARSLRNDQLRALLRRAAQQHLDLLVALAHVGHREPGHRVVEERGQVLRRDAEHARLVLVDDEADHLGRLVPIELHIGASRVRRASTLVDLLRDARARVARSSPETRNCTGKPTGGPFSRRDTRPRSAGSRRRRARRARAQSLALLVALRHQHELREVRAAAAAGRAAGRSADCRRRRSAT